MDLQWYNTGLGGRCGACEEARRVLDGHFACSPPAQIGGDIETVSVLVNGSWELHALVTATVAAEWGWELAS